MTAFRAPAPVHDGPTPETDRRVLPGGLERDPVRRAAAMVGLALVAVGLGIFGATTTVPSSALAMWIVSGIAVPLWLVALRPRGAVVIVAAVAALVVPLALRTASVARQSGPPQEAAHDGGVHVTRAAAEDVLGGRNPYAESFADDLPPSWDTIRVVPGEQAPNPVVDHIPYLPAAFLVAVPGVLLDRVAHVGGDPRWVMGLIVAAALIAVARRPEPEWARAAALFAAGSSFTIIYAAWGTNDAAAAALVVLAALWAADRPEWAGVALALAISYKAPLMLAVVPWAAWVVHRRGSNGLRRWWTLPAVLGATTVPYLLWSARDLVDDTVTFWLGRTDQAFPASGLGIAYRWPDLADGWLGAALPMLCAVAGLTLAWMLIRRVDHPAVLPVAAALVLLGLFVPARTFQPNYLALVTGMLAAGWLALPAHIGSGGALGAALRFAPDPLAEHEPNAPGH